MSRGHGGAMDAMVEESLRGFLERDDDHVEAALIVARILAPDADVDWARSEIAAIADRVRPALGEGSATALVAAISAEGFKGAGDRYYELDNSILDRVLRNRRGIPISLGVVLIGVAELLGHEAVGINFPRHFLVMIDDVLVDPYALETTTLARCRKWLADNKVSDRGAFDSTRPRDTVIRMLNNARQLVHGRGEFARALAISDYQLIVAPDYYGLYIERADAWLGLQAPEMVVEELKKAAERAPDARLAERLRERVAQAERLGTSVVN